MHKMGFIGASKTGTVLARYFKQKGLAVTGFYSITPSSLDETVKLVNCESFKEINRLVSTCDIIFITSKDDEIASLWNRIDKTLLLDKVICHCSGILSSDVFESSTHYYRASFHPMSSFNSKSMDIELLQGTAFALEGDSEALTVLKNMLALSNNPYIIIDKTKKTPYHIACVAVSSLFIGLTSFAKNLLDDSILEGNISSNVLLCQFTDNIIQKVFQGQQLVDIITGPLIREDISTLNKHVDYLNEEDKVLYQLLSKQLLQLLPRNESITNEI